MKKLYILLLFLPISIIAQTTYTSQSNGDWSVPATWSPNGVPSNLDTVIINNSVTITTGSQTKCTNLTINSGGVISVSSGKILVVFNLLTNNVGGKVMGGGILSLGGPVNGVFIKGGGDFSQETGSWYFAGNAAPGTATEWIDASVNIVKPTGSILIEPNGYNHPVRILNFGKVTLGNGSTLVSDGSQGDSWTQEANSFLQISTTNALYHTYDTLVASANGNTVVYAGGNPCTIKNPLGSTFYNFTCSNGSTISLPSNLTILGNLLISNGTLDLTPSNYNLNVGGNFTNNHSFNWRNSTVTLNGSLGQTVGGLYATGFFNLILSGTGNETVTLANAITVFNNLTISGGTLDCKTFQITGNSTGVLSMASGSSMLLGSTASATSVLFPTLFTSANTALNASSTVTYQTNGAQTVSSTPTYGNLIISTGAASSTKTPSGTPLNVAGDLTINTLATLSQTTNSANLTGNLTNNGTLSFSTGNFNIGGNFTNNGTFTAGTSTVSFTGTAGQTLGGTNPTTFDNLTASGNSGETVTLGNTPTITGNLLISGGTFDVSASNFGITLAGNLTNNGTFNARSGLVTLNGSAGQSLAGTNSISFYDLTIAGGSETVALNANESFSDVLTMSSGTLAGPDVMTLLSSAGRTARVAPILPGGGAITSNFIVQRYDGRTVANYEALSSPVVSTTLGDWNISNRTPPFYMSGVGGPDGNAGSYVSVYLYQEPSNAYSDITHFASPGISYPLPQGQGIYLWMGNSLSAMSPFTYITHGVPTVGPVTYNVTNTAGQGNGFNIIGNPYPSPLSWSSFSAGNPSLQSSYYLFEQDGSWHSFSSGSIAMEQGFGIVTSSSTSLSFAEAEKATVDAALQREGNSSDETNSETFTLSNDANNYSCPTTISFGANNSTNYSPAEDAIFIKSFIPEVPEVYSVSSDNQNLILNRLPDNDDQVYVPLVIIGNVTANYTLTATGLSSLPYQCVCLIDKESGNVVNNFEDNPSYRFHLQSGDQRNFIVRFTKLSAGQSCNSLTASSTLPGQAKNIDIYSISGGAEVNFNLPQQENAIISVYNVMGQKVQNDITTNALNNSILLNLPSKQQIYIIRVTTPGGVTTKKLYY